MKNKISVLIAVVVGVAAILGCKQLSQIGKNATSNTQGESTPSIVPSKAYTAEGKEWKSYDLAQTDIKIDLPASPSDKSPEMSPTLKEAFSAMRIYALDDKEFSASGTELIPTGKRKFQIKELSESNMTALKRQIHDLTYTVDIQSDTKATLNGTFTRNGKSFEVRGCCLYKKTDPLRVWTVLTLYAKDNPDATQAAQRVIDSVVFKGATEDCK